MAGIGFRLQRLLNQGSYGGLLQAYIYSAIISTGPWMLSIVGLALIGVAVRPFVSGVAITEFRCIVVYAYAASLILTGAVQLGTTRYLADRLFVHDSAALAPCYHWLGLLTLVSTGIIGASLAWLAGLDLAHAIPAVVLLQAISLTWMCMLFLSAAKDYLAICGAFALGYGVSVGACVLGAAQAGVPGMLWGFASGQVVLATLIGVRIRAEFPGGSNLDGRVVGHWIGMPYLVLIGLFYNLGIWADKLVMWHGPGSEAVVGLLRVSPRYDACMFFSYLTVVPAMALFLIRIEVAFYKHYAAFYSAITGGGDLATIMLAKQNMVAALRLSAVRLFKLQGTLTLGLVLLTPHLIAPLGLTDDHIPILRLALTGAFIQVLLQITLVVLLYFDWQRDTAWMTLIFAAANLLITRLLILGHESLAGLGYLAAGLIALIFGLVILNRRIALLEFETFVKQAIKG